MKSKKDLPSYARFFDRLANHITRLSGKPMAFIAAFLLIIGWGLSGPFFKFSDTWQLVINTGTTIITFLMVFIIQQTQNKDTIAIHLKLNELIACNESASNRLIDIEHLTEEELQIVKKFYVRLSELALKSNDLHSSHSLDDAESNHELKTGPVKAKLRNPSKSASK
ncbi:MAG: low affinity iron permease family protein [Chitinophagaceae bacterium]|nr:low affinity iron permease family protein [Chitinophagaceae bacterium]